MPKVGDQVIVEGTKIGNPKREGTLLGVVGPLINVRWSDGTTSLFKPGAGAVSYVPRNGAARAAAAAGRAKTAKPAAAAKKPAGKTSKKAQPTKGKTAGKAASGTKKTPSAKKTAKRGR